MRRRPSNLSAAAPHVNVTPMIDVVMCLIIFYLMVGHLASGRSGHVNLPSAGQGERVEQSSPIVINLSPSDEPDAAPDAEPVLLIGSERVAMTSLAQRLKDLATLSPGAEVQVRADRRLAYGSVSPVLTACREAGLLSVKLVAQRGAPVAPTSGGKP
ncbi:MAG: biopolymer transporter ExbD [Phycisphaerales bacterium]|nr:biopolymer transporter ExbD [Phycisphaerales bacterium]